jgi:HPt (histidine-containing phosphotransfer) domain-containing protein
MARLNNNKKLYIMLLKKFDAQSMLGELLEKVKAGDASGAAASAHTIKGLAANLSLTDLREKAENIEQTLKNGGINADTSEIEASSARTIEAVNAYIAENS